ncbi:hypothetical protein [Luteolibacter sp. Populi]|uniref:hypothetical protein n=1 Tax=Luteolibacter sp. Populi TaxID=3230487 RepID=UPI00346714B2
MKKVLGLISMALLALLTTSCFEQKAVIRLNKDGSGTITETTLLSAEASAMLDSIPAGAGGEDPLSKMADKEQAAANAKKIGEGVEVVKSAKIDKDGKKGVEVVYSFKDINKVSFTMGGSMAESAKAMNPAAAAKETEQKPVTFKYADGVLTLANPPNKPVEKPADAPKPEIGPQELEMAKGMFKDMRMSFKVEFADGLAETNASHVEGNTITIADIQFAKLMEDPEKLKKLMELNDEGPAAAAALFKDTPGIKVESKEELTVKLK